MKPFLKWAGNKYRILNAIQAVLADWPAHGTLIEPFAGSGAVFLNTSFSAYRLADTNADLIGLYRLLQSDGETFIDFARQWFTPAHNTAEAYYALRETFNHTTDPQLKAALFLYLNRHGYNGLCRYNAKGGFNVPFGRYRAPYFPEKELIAFSRKARQAEFVVADFEATMETARPGDVVYCDPPYVPLSETAGFTTYATGGFSQTDQERLAACAHRLAQRGIPVLLSNHDTPWTRALYADAELIPLSVPRFISCDGKNRVPAAELLVCFIPPASGNNLLQPKVQAALKATLLEKRSQAQFATRHEQRM